MSSNPIPGHGPARARLILDFDGTVALGDGPVYAYAQAVAEFLDAKDRVALLAALEAFLTGSGGAPEARFKDGYDAVAQLSAPAVSRAQRNAAYRSSREAIARGDVAVHAPDGLEDFLVSVAPFAERVLLTNAPLTGVAESLAALGLAEVIDSIIPEAGKPDGFAEKLPGLLRGLAPEELLSVGDVWLNDIAHPLAAGCATAFIDRFNLASGPAHLRAAHIEELYPGMLEWAGDPSAFSRNHAGQIPHSETPAH
ncbi:MAG: hydrolase [Renibacterium salmoninarum]|nr:hydrolase [Renibacterium salmoninarum]